MDDISAPVVNLSFFLQGIGFLAIPSGAGFFVLSFNDVKDEKNVIISV